MPGRENLEPRPALRTAKVTSSVHWKNSLRGGGGGTTSSAARGAAWLDARVDSRTSFNTSWAGPVFDTGRTFSTSRNSSSNCEGAGAGSGTGAGGSGDATTTGGSSAGEQPPTSASITTTRLENELFARMAEVYADSGSDAARGASRLASLHRSVVDSSPTSWDGQQTDERQTTNDGVWLALTLLTAQAGEAQQVANIGFKSVGRAAPLVARFRASIPSRISRGSRCIPTTTSSSARGARRVPARTASPVQRDEG